MPSLFVHIGTGKTGSTAIQNYLLKNRNTFAARGVHYWGINLENAPTSHRFSWQEKTGGGILQYMDVPQAKIEMGQALSEAIAALGPQDIAIWCNESIHERPDIYIPLLQPYQHGDVVNVQLFAYARNIGDYALSAYKQWGVKHKTNSGPVLDFPQWVDLWRLNLSYGNKLRHWDQAFPSIFNIVNYDVVADVTRDFISRVPRCEDLLPSQGSDRVYSSPADAPFALYALYNTQFSEPVLPATIESLLIRYGLINFDCKVDSLSQFYPSSEDLKGAVELLESDATLVNSMLERHKQPPLVCKNYDASRRSVSEQSIQSGVLSLLLRIIVEQEQRINALEAKSA